MIKHLYNRREALAQMALLATAVTPVTVFGKQTSYRLGACDWSLGKTMDPEAFDRAKLIGLQGVQVSYNTNKDANGLSNSTTLESIQDASRRTGIAISSLAIGQLNNIPYKSAPETEEWVRKSIDVAEVVGAPVILLAFFGNGDLRNDPDGIIEVIRRLKKVAPAAEKAGVTLGIESYLSAEQHLDIMQKVGSKSVKVYYDFRNAADAGYDIFKEIKLLGKKSICEIHMKENGFLLGKGPLNWSAIAKSLNQIGYKGWMQIEGALPKGAEIVDAYKLNRSYLEQTFSFKK